MLFKLLILGVAIYFGFSFFRKNKEKLTGKKSEEESSPVDLVKDPICDMFVEKDSPYKVKYYERIYYFCSPGCRDTFIERMKNGGN